MRCVRRRRQERHLNGLVRRRRDFELNFIDLRDRERRNQVVLNAQNFRKRTLRPRTSG